MNIDRLMTSFATHLDEPAIIWQDRIYTYQYLKDKIASYLDTLKDLAVNEGDIVALEGDYSPDITSALIAFIINKNIIVPINPLLKPQERQEYIKTSCAQKILAIDSTGHLSITRQDPVAEHMLLKKVISAKHPGLILFSSGSTGKSKAALHDFDKLISKYARPRSPLRALVFLLIDHIGGINTLFRILSSGGCAVCISSRRADDVCRAVEKHNIEVLPTTPTFLNLLLLSEAYKRYDMSSLKTISYGTEPMPDTTLARLVKIFPDVKFVQTYGLSELGILDTKSRSADSLWLKLGGDLFQTKVVDNTLWIRSDIAMLGYLNAPDPFDKDGWFNTEDEVIVEGEYMRILGRRSEIINVGGQKVYPAEVESILLGIDNVKDVVVRGEKNPLLGNIVTAEFTLLQKEEIRSLRKKVRSYCKDKLEDYKIPVRVTVAKDDIFNSRYKKMRLKQ